MPSEIPSEVSSTDSSSENSSDSDNELFDDKEADQVTAHETVWTFGNQVKIDTFKDGYYKPKLIRWTDDEVKKFSALKFWEEFFPLEFIPEILELSNTKLRAHRRSPLTKEELYKFFGILYAMTIQTISTNRDYWSVKDGLFPAPAFGKRFGMSRNRFEEIKGAITFCSEQNQQSTTDKWSLVRPFVDMLNERWKNVIRPGYKITVDESMFVWYGRNMPAVMKIRRKPKGIGCEVKNAADSVTNIMLRLEINEGKDEMSKKMWQKDFGAGTATTLRLLEPWFGSGRIVLGDSWFASVKTAVQLYERGLFFMGIVKTATKKFPLKEIRDRCPEGRGECVYATTKVENVQLLAMGWRDKKVISMVSTCGTTREGTPAKKKRWDEHGNTFYKSVKRPQLYESYFDGSASIDVHNHLRQDGLALENAWKTQSWEHRIIASLLGIIETNAYLAFQHFGDGDENSSHTDFTEMLAREMIFGKCPTPEQNVSIDDDGPTNQHFIQPLASIDDRQRKRVQRKCVICSKVFKIQRKASFFCVPCGPQAVLCNPATLRSCFAYHIENGLPS